MFKPVLKVMNVMACLVTPMQKWRVTLHPNIPVTVVAVIAQETGGLKCSAGKQISVY